MNTSPLMKQYLSIKEKYPNALLLFRVGDYYEAFYEDASTISSILDLTLTKTQKGIDLAGFEAPLLDNYLPKLVKSGHRVAICDKLEDMSVYPKDTFGRYIMPNAFESYGNGHPWYYHLRGPIDLPHLIEPRSTENFGCHDFPKDFHKLEALRKKYEDDLQRDIERYIECARELDPDNIDSCTSISLKHNHITYNLTMLKLIEQKGGKQISMF